MGKEMQVTTLIVCVVIAIAGCVTTQPPQFTQEPESTYVFELDENGKPANLTLSCGTTGDPTPTVTWFRSEMQVNSSLVLEDGTLSIANIAEGEFASRDGIPYYCTATNSLGTIRSKTVNVFYAFFDGISTPSGHENINVTTDHAVALLCDVPGASPPPVIEWLDDDGIISDTKRYLNGGQYLLFSELTVEQINKTYHCQVTNTDLHGTVESSGNYTLNNIRIQNNTLVVYKELETEITALVGDNVIFSFVAAASVTLFTQYKLNGNTLGIETSGPLGLVRNVSLPSDGNSYNVTLTINYGNQEMRTSTLTVYEAAAILDISPDDLDHRVEDPVSLSCIIIGNPTPDVTWYFNGGLITTSNAITIDGDTIHIRSPTTTHSGMYQCFASNPAKTVSASVALQIREAVQPQIVNLSVPSSPPTVGESFFFTCLVSGIPTPVIMWLKDGTVLRTGDRFSISLSLSRNESQLLILEATTDDTGDYTCNVSNIVGIVTETYFVQVEDNVTPTVQLRSTNSTAIGIGISFAMIAILGVVVVILILLWRRYNLKCKKYRVFPPGEFEDPEHIKLDEKGTDTWEYKTFKKNYSHLTNYLSQANRPGTIADELYAVNWIDPDLKDTANDTSITAKKRIRLILDDILLKIQIDKGYYQTFRNILLLERVLGPGVILDEYLPEKGPEEGIDLPDGGTEEGKHLPEEEETTEETQLYTD